MWKQWDFWGRSHFRLPCLKQVLSLIRLVTYKQEHRVEVLGYSVPYYPPNGGTQSTLEYFARQSAHMKLPDFIAKQ